MRYILFVWVMILPVVVSGQRPKLYVARQRDHAFVKVPVLDETGKVVFRFDEGHTPMVSRDRSMFEPYTTLNPFASGPCLVMRTRKPFPSYYLVNEHGKMVKDLGNEYDDFEAFHEGYALVRKTVGYKHHFMDSVGNLAFGGESFLHAEPFSNGYAAVKRSSGEWAYLDRKGNTVMKITPPGNEGVIYYAWPFDGKFALVSVLVDNKRPPFLYYVIDHTGKMVVDVQKVLPEERINAVTRVSEGAFLVNIGGYSNKVSTAVLISTEGKILRRFPEAIVHEYYKPLTYGIGAVSVGRYDIRRAVLFDATGKNIQLQYDSTVHTLMNVLEITPRYYLIQGEHRRIPYQYIFSRATNELVYTCGQFHDIMGIEDDFAYVRHFSTDEELINLTTGKAVFQADDFSFHTHVSLTELTPTDKVLRLHLDDVKELKDPLFQLKDLEYLFLDRGDVPVIPANIGKLKKLRRLDLYGLKKITALPATLAQLPLLEELRIQRCYRAANIYAIVSKLPALKRLYLENVPMDEAAVKKLQQLKPNLKIHYASTADSEMERDLAKTVEVMYDGN